MPIPITTELEVVLTSQLMTMLFGSPRTLTGALVATGIDFPLTIRIPSLMDSNRGLRFQPWFGLAPETLNMQAHMAVVTLREGSPASTDVAIAVIHVKQSDAHDHPVNRCIAGHFENEEGEWHGNIILLEYDKRSERIMSLREENAKLAADCLEQFIEDYWKAIREGTDLIAARSRQYAFNCYYMVKINGQFTCGNKVVPTEVDEIILCYAVASANPWVMREKARWDLIKVCRRWRTTMHRCPQIWRDIVFHIAMGRAHTAFLCERIPQGVNNLRLTFDTENDYLTGSAFSGATRSNGSIDRWIANVLPLCTGAVSRASTILVRSLTHAYVSTILSTISLPNSTHITAIHCYAHRPSLGLQRVDLPPMSDDPQLRILRLNGVTPTWTTDTVYTTLTHLSLRHIFTAIDRAVVSAMLISSPALVYLELVVVNIIGDFGTYFPPICAPSVTHLTLGLESIPLFHIPANLALPALKSLNIESSTGGWTETAEACRSYLKTVEAVALSCRTLDVTALTFIRELCRAKRVDLSNCSSSFVEFVGENSAVHQPHTRILEWVVPSDTRAAVVQRFMQYSSKVAVYERSKEVEEDLTLELNQALHEVYEQTKRPKRLPHTDQIINQIIIKSVGEKQFPVFMTFIFFAAFNPRRPYHFRTLVQDVFFLLTFKESSPLSTEARNVLTSGSTMTLQQSTNRLLCICRIRIPFETSLLSSHRKNSMSKGSVGIGEFDSDSRECREEHHAH
ncbi:hypothetical protein R3P38DRAFT_2780627 [Favolaschia claudopus]|uniref:F-box domain-containing protein n=1 Tax=Favolaschia claudopus TaxID=2862362 RepID=A0AAW0BAU0_9AGAR